ncbi:peripheral-type benzodiazepine receptor-associated protein 1-like [Sceloporus undulatus]|uniref:peripheral-type benzodiazepine receptor-associated protein 1-like n=1 Tax=Sceloporus undulatus TaxID=8520 RepID=UPI001C4C6BF2|nr:peripheral-type benzodiazepine receptor-associated protein 1-like [Sceloporus undulatus]
MTRDSPASGGGSGGGGPSPPLGTSHSSPRSRASSQPNSGGGGGVGSGQPPSSSSCSHEDHRRELEALRSELEAERLRSQENRRRFSLEARELRETAERERQRLSDQLRSKWEQQRARELHQMKEEGMREREAEIRQLLRWKEAELREAQELLQRERDSAMRHARELQRQLAEELVNRGGGPKSGGGGPGPGLSSEGRAKLQEVLGKLRWEVDSEQAIRIRHLKAELELERSLFLKYILQRFEGDQASTLGGPQRATNKQASSNSSGPKPAKRRPRSLESLVAACCAASKSRSVDSNLNHQCQSPEEQQQQEALLLQQEENNVESKADCSQKQQLVPGNALDKEALLEDSAKQDESEDAPPEGKVNVLRPLDVAKDQPQQELQTPEWLSGSNYDRLMRQNADLLEALAGLEQRCTHLKEENSLLRKSSFPEMKDKVKRLKRKNAELASIAKRLEERAKRLQESSLRIGHGPIPLAMSCSDMDLYKTSFARQRAKDLSEQAGVLFTKDKQLDALQRECWELHAKLSASKESSSLLNIYDFDRLLRESQREILRLQRQIMLKNLRESLQQSKVSSDYTGNIQEIPLETHLQDTSFPKQVSQAENTFVKNTELELQPAGNGTQNDGNSLLQTDSDSVYHLQVLKEKLSEKSKQCETLEHEMEEKQKRYDDLELQLKEVLKENVRITEENSQLQKKNEWIEKIENENAEIKMKLIQATDDRNSAVQSTKGLESKVENLEQVINNLKEIAERRQQLASKHEETLLVLQKKEEEIRQLQKIQTETKRENEEAVQLLQHQVKELENQCHSQTKHFDLLAQELQNKKSGSLKAELFHAIYSSTSIICQEKWNDDSCHNFHHGKNINDKDSASIDCTGLPQTAKELESHSDSSESDSKQNNSKSSFNQEEDIVGEAEELETDTVSINFEQENPGPAKLRVFLARYSYDPFDGPNKNPEAELPLTAGEYVYICGDMDEDGFYEGELMDGRRGMVPSNLVEEVSGNDLISFVPSEATDISYRCCHEIGCPCQNASSEEKSDSPDEDVCVNLLSNGLGRGPCGDQTAVPYPQNLTLIRQSAKSIVIGWDPPPILDNCGEVHSYNIYINGDLCCNVKPSSQMKAVIENLDLKSRSYRISVQSVTDKGNSDKFQCTFLIGNSFHISPTHLEIRDYTATSAEITWLPSNSNYNHTIYLNEKEYDITKAGIYWYTFRNLKPNNQYNIKVETRAPHEELFPRGHLEQKSSVITFTTLLAGPPNAPLDVQVQPSSSAGFLIISWLPVTIDKVGSSNGVKVTGYAIYINGKKVTQVMSPTAGSVSLAASQLLMFHGSWKVSVRTLSPFGESVDSVPALIPPVLLHIPHSLLSKPVPCLQAPESEDGPFYSHLPSADNNFTIHFTSNCKEPDTAIPGNITQNQGSSSVRSTSHRARSGDKGYSNPPTSLWKQSSEHVFPALGCGESANSVKAASHVFAEDTQKEWSEENLHGRNPTFKSQPDSKKIRVYPVTQFSNMTANDSPLQHYPENSGAGSWSPESGVFSKEFIPKKGLFKKKPIKQRKQLCKELSNLKVSKIEMEQVSRAESWKSLLGDHNYSSDLSDIEKEEKDRVKYDGQGTERLQERPTSLIELTKEDIITLALRKSQTTSSVPNSSTQRSLIFGDTFNDDSERLFVALFDYDPVITSPNSEAAREELSFKEGQILKVIGDKDDKGFYRGECEEKQGYIPCHLVSEIYIESKEVKKHLLKKRYIMDENLETG